MRGRRRAAAVTRRSRPTATADSRWYKEAVIYELHLRTFYDSDGDSIGDFAGLTTLPL